MNIMIDSLFYGRRRLTVLLISCGILLTHAGAAEAQISAADEAQMMAEIDAAEEALEELRATRDELWEQRPKTLGQGDALAAHRDAVEEDVEVLRERWNKASQAYESSRVRRETAATALQMVLGEEPKFNPTPTELGQWSVKAQAAKDRLAAVEAEVRRLSDETLAAQEAYFVADRGAAPIKDAATTALLDRTAWEPEYRAANYAVQDARIALERARERARIALRKNSPPILYRVSTPEVGETGYRGEWTGGEEQAVERLRMAQYLHLELTRTLREREERLRQWSPIHTDALVVMQRAERTYTRQYDIGPETFYAVGDYIYAWVTTGEGEEWTGPPHFPVPQAWAKTLLTAGEVATGSIVGSKSSLDALANATFELAKRMLDGTYWGNNPTWNVNESSDWNIKGARPTYEASMAENAVFERVTPLHMRALVEGLAEQHADVLAGDNYEKALFEKAGIGEIGFAITDAIIGDDDAVFASRVGTVQQPERGEFILPRAVYQDLEASQKLFENAFLNGLKGLFSDVRPDDFDEFNSKGLVSDMVKSVIIDYARKQTDVMLAEAELAVYVDFIVASYDLLLIEIQKEFDERYWRLEHKMIMALDETVIPTLAAELKIARSKRTLEQPPTLGLVGKESVLILSFSRPVKVTQVTVNDRPAEVTGAGAVWRAKFENRPIWDEADDNLNAMAHLKVDAHLANFPEVALDDPETIQTYEAPPTDPPHHVMRLFPGNRTPLVSPGRVEGASQETIMVQAVGIAFVGDDAWIGIVPKGTPKVTGDSARSLSIRTIEVGNGQPRSLYVKPPPVGSYSVRLYESADGPEVSRAPMKVCKNEDIGTLRCLVDAL